MTADLQTVRLGESRINRSDPAFPGLVAAVAAVDTARHCAALDVGE